MSFSKRERIWQILLNLLLICGGIIAMLPFWAMIIPSFTPLSKIYSGEFSFLPKYVTLEGYSKLFFETDFVRWVLNSVCVSVGSVILGIFFSSLGGFAFAKYNFKGKKQLFWIVLGSITLPQVVTIIPMYALLNYIGWINTYQALIIPFATNAFAIFFMRQYIFFSIPSAMMDAAKIDGCSDFGIYYRIILPTIRPAIATVAIFLWLWSWNAYFWPLVMLQTSDMYTIPLGLATLYADPFHRDMSLLMAGSFLSLLPIVVVFIIMQREFIAGLTYGSIKE